MLKRFLMKEIQPRAHKVLRGLEHYLDATDIAPLHKELIKIRASQMNGCAFCLNLHTRDARKLYTDYPMMFMKKPLNYLALKKRLNSLWQLLILMPGTGRV